MHSGDPIGNYYILERIGHGGTADVYLAEHKDIKGKRVAVKVLRTSLTVEDRNSIKIEAQRLYDLKHANMVPVIDVFDDPQTGAPCLMMEYAENGSLSSKHPRGVPLPKETILRYVQQVAEALACVHQHGLIHRDVKPANILLGPNGVVWLSDIGIAVEQLSAQVLTLHGTPHYMSPEQAKGRSCPASDQYALAVMVYEWLCGERPFKGSDPLTVALQHEQSPPPSLRGRVPHLSDTMVTGVEAVVFKALAKDPEQRFGSTTDFATALQQALTETTVPLPVSVSLAATSQVSSEQHGEKVSTFLRPLAAVVLVFAFVCGCLPQISNALASFNSSSAHVIITSKVTPWSNWYLLTGVTSAPNPAQRQILVRQITADWQGERTVPATGFTRFAGTSATGTITFSKSGGYSQAIPAGTPLFSSNGLEILTDRAVSLGPGKVAAVVPAHVVQLGAVGNGVYVKQSCCNRSKSILATSGPFSGGGDSGNDRFIQQSDINGAANALSSQAAQQAKQQLQRTQIRPNEALVGSPDCKQADLQSDHYAGDRASSVTVAVTVTCTSEAYDRQGAQDLLTTLLKREAGSLLGRNYVLQGQVQVSIDYSAPDPDGAELWLEVNAHGLWAYQFSMQRVHDLLKLINGKTEAEATKLLLLQDGVEKAKIEMMHSATLPTNLSQITISVNGSIS